MEKLNYLFVYGTLKKDQTASWSNALEDEKFIGYGKIKGFDMYKIMNSYPGIKKGAGEVLGELYEITNQDTWKKVDKIECVNIDLYHREVVDVYLNDKIIKAYAYIYQQNVYDDDKMDGPIYNW